MSMCKPGGGAGLENLLSCGPEERGGEVSSQTTTGLFQLNNNKHIGFKVASDDSQSYL